MKINIEISKAELLIIGNLFVHLMKIRGLLEEDDEEDFECEDESPPMFL